MTLALAFSLLAGGGGKIEWEKFTDAARLDETLRKTRALCVVYFTADW